MKSYIITLAFCLLAGVSAFGTTIQSPSKNLTLMVGIDDKGVIHYDLLHNAGAVIQNSKLGFTLKDAVPLDRDFVLLYETVNHVDTSWQPVWGEVATIRNNYTELIYHVRQTTTKVQMYIVFRLFDDGLGFRYEFPHQPELKYFIIADELTEFKLSGNHTAFWIPGDYDTNEYPYTKSKLSDIDAVTVSNRYTEIATRTPTG